MSLTITKKLVSPLIAGWGIGAFEVTFDSSYPTGGETLDLSDYFSSAETPIVAVSPQTSGYHLCHDGGTVAAGKILVVGTGAAEKGVGTQVDNATNLSTLVCDVIVLAKMA